MAAMPGCDFGPGFGRTGVTWNLTVVARADNGALILALPHAPDIVASGMGTVLMLSGDITARVGSGRDFDASQEVTIACGGESRKERIDYRGQITREGSRSELKLSAQVTRCPGNSCPVSVSFKLKSLPE